MQRLPLISEDLPGIGGVIKSSPEHFRVEEVLPYAPCGEGEHVFVTLRRSGWNTADVARCLANTFSLKPMDVGWGGRKDRQALTTQTFSLPLPLSIRQERISAALADTPFEILQAIRHRNKIKTGHVAGNRFRIVVTGACADALERARPIAQRLARYGIPNYFGPQRFGHGMSNLNRAAALLASAKGARGKKNSFWVSALQGALFNQWLADRIQRDDFDRILDGDVAKKTDTGGLFIVDDPIEAAERFGRGAIVYTGPLPGHKMMPAAGTAGGYEAELMDRFELSSDMFKKLRAQGTRRAAVLGDIGLSVKAAPEGMAFSFYLPSGAYATTVLQEFIKAPSDTPGGTSAPQTEAS